jgi:phosphatidylserine/phosphatidylglycerophosphate/cardiolipin synthase-like enzyme
VTVLAFGVFASRGAGPRDKEAARTIDALFSPGGGCESRIIEEISSAEKNIRVQMYLFTSKPICDALVAAKKRGVAVQVILDKSQEKMSFGRWPVLKRGGVQVYFDRDHEIANSKIILIDQRAILTGSYNLTQAAEEKNSENLVVIENDEELFEKFLANFEKHRAHSHRGSG